MFDDTYKTIATPTTGNYNEKRSRFIAYAFPVRTEAEVRILLTEIRKKHADARHHCYAYILGPHKDAHRFNDDGEPSGTAGRPIYGQLLSLDLTDVLVVVVRYFGGIKLGVSGLQNAYRTAARTALEMAAVVEKTIDEWYEITFEYSQMNAVMRVLKNPEVSILNQKSDLCCIFQFSVRQSKADRIIQALKLIPQVKVKMIAD